MRRALQRLRALFGREPAGGPWRATDPELPAASAGAPVASASGLSRWRLERELARGSMGTVWLARHPDDGRPVAIKTVPLGPPGGDDAARARFRREAAAAQRLEHPDIVRVYEVGETDRLAWIAMELVQGHDLSRYTEPARRLPLPLVLHIGERVARALQHAHGRGVVHRDVKPANVLVDIGAGRVKVTDFGTAHLSDAERSRSGLVLGSPSYMAPEQLAGRAPDARADVYALGATLYHLIAGRLPHEADSLARLLAAIAHEPVPDLRSLRPDVPEALADVIALALQKRPETRYASAAELADDLRAVQALLDTAAAGPAHADVAGRDIGHEGATSAGNDADPRHNAGRR